jgi:hypothetical protein
MTSNITYGSLGHSFYFYQSRVGLAGPPPQYVYKNGAHFRLSRVTGDIRGGDFLCDGLREGEVDRERLVLLYYTYLLIYDNKNK